MQLIPLKSPLIQAKDDLFKIILTLLKAKDIKPQEQDVFIISSKVVALSENQIVKLDKVEVSEKAQNLPSARYVQTATKNEAAFKQLILDEADSFLDGENVYLTLKDNILIPNSGIDLSNVPKGSAILWPKDSFQSAQLLKEKLQLEFKLKECGVVIIDSHCQPMRAGVVGIALGWSGIEGVEDERGKKDLYGKELQVTQKNTADQLASAASLLMGEGGESIPFVLVQNAPIKFSNQEFNQSKYAFDLKDDLFAGIYNDKIKE